MGLNEGCTGVGGGFRTSSTNATARELGPTVPVTGAVQERVQ